MLNKKPAPIQPAQLWTVAKHVGRFGRPGGDIAATGHLKLFRPGEAPEESHTDDYATVAVFGTRTEAQNYLIRHAIAIPGGQ